MKWKKNKKHKRKQSKKTNAKKFSFRKYSKVKNKKIFYFSNKMFSFSFFILGCHYSKKQKENMIAPYLPSILVPIVGIFLPLSLMAVLFVVVEKESIE